MFTMKIREYYFVLIQGSQFRQKLNVKDYVRISWSISNVQRTPHSSTTKIENVGVNHGGADIFVAQKFLHRSDIIAIR